ncbi:ATP-binding protein [Streptomyces sp. TRM66268-LWL]|uniref:ATP-binding protein n=1 Tax=Streptomyces polyasparticus TaxID=2767826 RepID=A0ABR7SLZ9_9ACTN|nr:ATP-binding protein [Streptomyces polyasparticus]MBC9715720.1 ATP-binding protein [Streptomyces polyasparticus]
MTGGHLPPASSDQYVLLPEARLVSTRAVLTARENLADTIEARAMMCVHGGAGFGKTMAVTSCLRALEPDEDIRRITFHARATTRAVRHELFNALELPGQPPRYASEFDHHLKHALATHPRTLVFDEAQWLQSDQLEYVRYLWDDPYTQIAVVFVGGEGCHHTLRKEPMLSSRIFIWQHFTRLTPDEVLQTIPLYHPIWANTDPDHIAYADKHAAHGNFRNWARLTALARTALKRTGRTSVDQEVLRWTFSRLSSGQ